MHKRISPLTCAVLLTVSVLCVAAGADYPTVHVPVVFLDTSTNFANTNLSHLDFWRVYPTDNSGTIVDTTSPTNTVTMVDATNAPATVTAPVVPVTPPPPAGSQDPIPNNIQSSPTLQGDRNNIGPI